MNTFSLVLNHTPWRPERVAAKAAMLAELEPVKRGIPYFLNDTDFRALDWQQAKVLWALQQWRIALAANTTHHVFMTDDLHLVPGFWEVLGAMVAAHPDVPIGLLSNHPRGPDLYASGAHGYRTNSWIVGPAYVLPNPHLRAFLRWFETLPEGSHLTLGTRAYRNDDSSINEWNTHHGPAIAWHPLPTIIEHRIDVESTTGHGDAYSRERISWRATREVAAMGSRLAWFDTPLRSDLEAMKHAEFWQTDAPMLSVGGFRT